MVNATYDHILAIIIVCAIFVIAVVIMPQLSIANTKTVDEQQLRNTALNVFNAMLLDTGLGVNGTELTTEWGCIKDWSPDKVVKFGLASSRDSTFYVLDPNKVQRLVKDNPLGELPYSRVKEILELEGYDFYFKISPPFNVTNIDGTKIDNMHPPLTLIGSTLKYAIKVTQLDGRPIPNAAVEAYVFYTTRDYFYPPVRTIQFTDSLGQSTYQINLETSDIRSLITVFRVTVSDVATVVVTYKSGSVNIVDINLVGDELILTRTKYTPNDNIWIMNATYVPGYGGLSYLFNSSRKNDQNYQLNTGAKIMWNNTYRGLSYDEPVCIVLNLWAVDPNTGVGRTEIVIAGPFQNIMGYAVFDYGASPAGYGSVRLQRSVIISGMTYTAELWLWKRSP